MSTVSIKNILRILERGVSLLFLGYFIWIYFQSTFHIFPALNYKPNNILAALFVLFSILTLGVSKWLSLLKTNKLLLLLPIYALLSSIFSTAPIDTAYLGIYFLLTTQLALWIYARWSIRQIEVGLIILAAGITGAALYAFYFFPEKSAFHTFLNTNTSQWEQPSWMFKGFTFHKNRMGQLLALSSAILVAFLPQKIFQLRNLLFLALLSLCFALILYTESKGALLTLALLGISLLLQRASKNLKIAYITFLFIFFSASSLVGVFLEPSSHVTGDALRSDTLLKLLTFSGRTELWSAISNCIGSHWIEGFGFGNFWVMCSPVIEKGLGYKAYHAHNDFVETFAQSGLVGVLILLTLIATTMRAYLVNLDASNRWNNFGNFFFIFVLCSAYFESGPLDFRTIYFLIFSIVYLARPKGLPSRFLLRRKIKAPLQHKP